MARDNDEDTRWVRTLLAGLAALVAVALVIGGVVSVVALGAAKVTGIGDTRPQPTARPSLFIPSGEPTTTPEAFPDPPGSTASPSPRPSRPSATAKPRKRPPAISLRAFPRRVGTNQRINLAGAYRGGQGRRLQVQRFEGRWVDFPVTATVRGGSFRTFIFSGRSGANRFRVLDEASGRASNAVQVVIG
jgi:hypothetical protein